jgi:hypothetical protein
MPDRVHIDVHIASKKMFGLRIVSTAEDFFDKNLSAAGYCEHPEQPAQQQGERQKPGSCDRSQRKLITF